MRFLLIACVVVFTAITVHAGEDILQTHQSAQMDQRVQLVTDQERGVLSIQIDGELVAFFTKDGLHVVKDIEYGGTLTDTGGNYINSSFETLKNGESADEK